MRVNVYLQEGSCSSWDFGCNFSHVYTIPDNKWLRTTVAQNVIFDTGRINKCKPANSVQGMQK